MAEELSVAVVQYNAAAVAPPPRYNQRGYNQVSAAAAAVAVFPPPLLLPPERQGRAMLVAPIPAQRGGREEGREADGRREGAPLSQEEGLQPANRGRVAVRQQQQRSQLLYFFSSFLLLFLFFPSALPLLHPTNHPPGLVRIRLAEPREEDTRTSYTTSLSLYVRMYVCPTPRRPRRRGRRRRPSSSSSSSLGQKGRTMSNLHHTKVQDNHRERRRNDFFWGGDSVHGSGGIEKKEEEAAGISVSRSRVRTATNLLLFLLQTAPKKQVRFDRNCY